ncbi:hypothetical protein PSACC_00555 [Paramicrosporidium saccamoebae]|uniref:histone deacetylase n=1 Tax=Paramicrosporidium saccamoebae TaxID=1246581 RepID=A0A2H9TPF5_9FUNG|nr:hypothetical protein PSACC_00555 [Paramicrosporidium saccamoebae]
MPFPRGDDLVWDFKPGPARSAVSSSSTSACAMTDFLLDDVFEITAVDPDGKKFDRVSRIQAKSDNYDMSLLLDVNVELYALQKAQKFTLVLTKSIALDASVGADAAWRSDAGPTLADKYEYVMYGRVFKFEDISTARIWGVMSNGSDVVVLLPHLKALAGNGKSRGPTKGKTGYTFDERMLYHRDPEDDHPEQPARIEGILQLFQELGLLERCIHIAAGKLPTEALQAVHSQELLTFIDQLPVEVVKEMDSVYLCPESEIAAKAAVTCTTKIARDIAMGKIGNGFALAMGFCIFNNVAVAAKELQRLGLARKIIILDWDIHYGNGTQKIFASDPDVLFISIHRYDDGKFYPSDVEGSPTYVGEASALGSSVNIGWNGPGVTDADYAAAFSRIVMPIAAEFRPDFVFVSAGFDAAQDDPIGECLVTPNGFAQMTHQLMSLAAGKVLLVLEGGYNVPVISNCAVSCLKTLLGDPIPYVNTQSKATVPSEQASKAISATIKAQSAYWKSLYPKHHQLRDDFGGITTLQRMSVNRVFTFGTVYNSASESNIANLQNSMLHQPFQGYIKEALRDNWAVIDLHYPAKEWTLKQTQTGSPKDLTLLNELMLYIWDHFLVLSESPDIFFVSSGLPSYAVCHLLDQRAVQHRVKGVVVISPTLYLPVASSDRSEWYGSNSLVIVPTKRPEGTPIATNPSFGRCVSAGSEDPAEIATIVAQSQNRVFSFIEERTRGAC